MTRRRLLLSGLVCVLLVLPATAAADTYAAPSCQGLTWRGCGAHLRTLGYGSELAYSYAALDFAANGITDPCSLGLTGCDAAHAPANAVLWNFCATCIGGGPALTAYFDTGTSWPDQPVTTTGTDVTDTTTFYASAAAATVDTSAGSTALGDGVGGVAAFVYAALGILLGLALASLILRWVVRRVTA